MEICKVAEIAQKMKENMRKVIVGKDEVLEKVIISVLCGGHILLEDLPGTGKTTLAKTLSKSIDCTFKRIQFTPDLLPSDVTGINFYNQKNGEFVFRPGAVFTNILLGDEINRATPRTQSSLLECMEEHQVSVDGETYPMAKPFFVIATQNPIEIQGTFPLPEAQLDRFFMRLSMGYPDKYYEREMLSNFRTVSPLATLESVVSKEEITEAQEAIRNVRISDAVKDYLLSIVEETRQHEKIRLGVSPRGSLAFLRGAQAFAAIQGRDYVLPDDVKAVCADILGHRIICKGSNASQSAAASAKILELILLGIPTPVENEN